MPKVIFTCETITPMFLTGADGSTPELRVPSIKGALRFWWRALNGHLLLKNLKEKEGELFGNTTQRSKVIVRVTKTLDYKGKKAAMLPHKEGNSQSFIPCFEERESFEVQLTMPEEYIPEIKALFILTTLLGGLGKRSRRGFGSVKITAIDGKKQNPIQGLDDLIPLLDSTYFSIDKASSSIQSKEQKNNAYPYIKEIQIGTSSKSLKEIIAAAHNTKKKDGQRAKDDSSSTYFEKALGDGKNRLASPIYISYFADNNIPILTTLNNPILNKTPSTKKKEYTKLQKHFKEQLLR